MRPQLWVIISYDPDCDDIDVGVIGPFTDRNAAEVHCRRLGATYDAIFEVQLLEPDYCSREEKEDQGA